MPHEKPRPPAYPSSPSFHTSPAPSTKGVFRTKQRWVRAHAIADQSSQDRRARTGADTQRVAYARALRLQVRQGGRTTTSMYCDTNVSKLLARSTSDNYIRCLLPQSFVPACPMPCPCLCERSVCVRLPYLLCLHRFEFSDFCVRFARWACTHASKLVHACALLLCDIQRGCARALLSMWVHAYFFSAICNEHWVLISFGETFVYLRILALAVILSPIPLPIPSPTTLGPTSPVSSFPVDDHLVGTPTLDHNGRAAAKPTIGARQRRICLSACSPLPAPCAAKISHPASHTHNTLECTYTLLPPPPHPHRCTS